jgi:hypothetical protein
MCCVTNIYQQTVGEFVHFAQFPRGSHGGLLITPAKLFIPYYFSKFSCVCPGEMANLGFVFTECLRSGFALPSLPEAKKRGRQEGRKKEGELRIENYPGAAANFQLSTFNFQLKKEPSH